MEQVLDENSPRWITSVKLTRLSMGEKVSLKSEHLPANPFMMHTLSCTLCPVASHMAPFAACLE